MQDLYKGNMKDFVEQVSLYLSKMYDKRVDLQNMHLPSPPRRRIPNTPQLEQKEGAYYQLTVVIRSSNDRKEGVRIVYDREDFEQQVYDAINDIMDDSSWTIPDYYDEFPDSPERWRD